MAFKITQEQDKCIGCGACAALDPTNWSMDGDKATLIDGKDMGNSVFSKTVSDAGQSKDSANACPVSCIKVEDA